MPPRRRPPSFSAARPDATTRRERIDSALTQAGWDVADPTYVGREIPVNGTDPATWQRLQAELNRLRRQHRIAETPLPAGISDYALCRPNGETACGRIGACPHFPHTKTP